METTMYHPDPTLHRSPPRPRLGYTGLHSLVWVSASPPVLMLLIHVDGGRCAVHRELGVVHLRREGTGVSTV